MIDFEKIPCDREIYKLLLTVGNSKPSKKHLMNPYMPSSVENNLFFPVRKALTPVTCKKTLKLS